MRLLVVAAALLALAGCGSQAAAAPAAAPPTFDTITIDVTGSNPARIIYDLTHGSDPNTRSWQVALTTPFHYDQTTPHGPHDIKVSATTEVGHPVGPPFNCTVRVNGQIVAAAVETDPAIGAVCAWSGTP